MMGTVPAQRRGVAAGARMMLQNTGAVISIAFVLAIITAAVPQDVLLEIFSGVSSGLSDAQLEPFIHNMHTALWVLAATSLAGRVVSLLRPALGERAAGSRGERHDRGRAERGLRIGEVARRLGTTHADDPLLRGDRPARAAAPAARRAGTASYGEEEVDRLRDALRLKSTCSA